ncbi:MAG: YbaN family protein [Coriobacteriales bacterium]|nr:YbaN family protein [Coriobacteriales bacterium]
MLYLGFFFAALGGIGVILPILPTTPFLLLAAACFANGSERFHSWFCSTKLYKNHLESLMLHRSMPMKTKLCICIPVSTMLIVLAAVTPVLLMRIFLAALIAVKWWCFMVWIKTDPVA